MPLDRGKLQSLVKSHQGQDLATLAPVQIESFTELQTFLHAQFLAELTSAFSSLLDSAGDDQSFIEEVKKLCHCFARRFSSVYGCCDPESKANQLLKVFFSGCVGKTSLSNFGFIRIFLSPGESSAPFCAEGE